MRSLSLILVVTSMSLACVAHTESSASQQSPLVECTGTYVCGEGEFASPMSLTLHREEGQCLLGNRPLLEDGTSPLPEVIGSWQGTAQSFTVCVSGHDRCFHCALPAPKPTDAGGSSSGTHCSGTPDSCSSGSPGSCSSIRGCRMATHVRYDGSYDNECEGTPDRCDSISSAEACIRQGCDWK